MRTDIPKGLLWCICVSVLMAAKTIIGRSAIPSLSVTEKMTHDATLGKINKLMDMADIADCEINIGSHTHLPATLRTTYYH